MKNWPVEAVLEMILRVNQAKSNYNNLELSALTADIKDYFHSGDWNSYGSTYLSSFEWHLLFSGQAESFCKTIRDLVSRQTDQV